MVIFIGNKNFTEWYVGNKKITEIWKWNEKVRPNEYLGSDIVITAEITVANQTVKINKYFANAHSINRWDGGATTNHTADTTHTYTSPGTYEITLSLGSGVSRWTFVYTAKPLVPKSWTTANNVYISKMPKLSDWFGNSATSAESYFFDRFNAVWALTSLPAGSFDTSNITSVGNYFFAYFNYDWVLTSLPAGSFDTSNITSEAYRFFYVFNQLWKIPKTASWVSIKNSSRDSVTFYHWNWSASVSEFISAWWTFTAYTSS